MGEVGGRLKSEEGNYGSNGIDSGQSQVSCFLSFSLLLINSQDGIFSKH
jgi:hypothetical protein